MWYYELNQQPFGPVSKETIADELKAGRITRMTLVWREGWAKWQCLGETELAALAGLPPINVDANAPQQVYANVPQYKKVKPDSLIKLFWWWFALTLFVIPLYLLSFIIKDQNWLIGLVCIFEIPLMASGVLQYILIYKFWQIVQDGFARTTPGKAVGFMFIPFFNFYWIFVAYFGLAKDQKAYVERHFNPPQYGDIYKAHPTLALCYLIVGWLFILFYFIFIAVMMGSMFSQMSDPTNITNSFQPYSVAFAIYGFVQMILMMVMFFDLFKASKSILKAEGL